MTPTEVLARSIEDATPSLLQALMVFLTAYSAIRMLARLWRWARRLLLSDGPALETEQDDWDRWQTGEGDPWADPWQEYDGMPETPEGFAWDVYEPGSSGRSGSSDG